MGQRTVAVVTGERNLGPLQLGFARARGDGPGQLVQPRFGFRQAPLPLQQSHQREPRLDGDVVLAAGCVGERAQCRGSAVEVSDSLLRLGQKQRRFDVVRVRVQRLPEVANALVKLQAPLMSDQRQNARTRLVPRGDRVRWTGATGAGRQHLFPLGDGGVRLMLALGNSREQAVRRCPAGLRRFGGSGLVARIVGQIVIQQNLAQPQVTAGRGAGPSAERRPRAAGGGPIACLELRFAQAHDGDLTVGVQPGQACPGADGALIVAPPAGELRQLLQRRGLP